VFTHDNCAESAIKFYPTSTYTVETAIKNVHVYVF